MRKIILVVTTISTLSLVIIVTGFSLSKGGQRSGDVKFVVRNSLQTHGIEVIGASDPGFTDELRKFTSDEQINRLVNGARPFALFIRNNSQREVVGVSLRWTTVNSKGDERAFPQSRSHPGVLIGMKPLDPSMIGKTSLINPGELQFFSYLDIQQTVLNARLRAQNSMGSGSEARIPAKEMDRMVSTSELQRTNLLNQISDLYVSIDGVFFDDGSFVGEDKNFYFDEIRGMVNARRDFLMRLVDAESAGEPASETISKFIESDQQTPVPLSRPISREQAYDNSYSATFSDLRKQILMMRKMNRTDTMILRSFSLAKGEDFKAIRRIVG